MRYYKFLTADNKGAYSDFDFTDYLPVGDNPGMWLPEIQGDLMLCKNGYHATDSDHLLNWRNAQLFEVELAGAIETGDDKCAASRIRFIRKIETWNDETLKAFILWIANGDEEEATSYIAARAATWDAARAAASADAWADAWDVAWDAQNKHLAEMLGLDG